MRIAHIAKVTGIAGAEAHLLRLLDGLRTCGVQSCMAVIEDSQNPPDGFCAGVEASGAVVDRIPIHGNLDPGLKRRLRNWLEKSSPDCVHTHMIHADLYGLAAATDLGIEKTVSTRHNTDPFRRLPWIRWINKRAMQRAQRVVAISRAVARFVVEIEGVNPAKVLTIPYGLETPQLDPDARIRARNRLGYGSDDRLVGFAGRLVRQKGVDVLLDAFRHVHRSHPEAKLAVFGDGPLRSRLQARAVRLNLGDRVQFHGWIGNAFHLMPAFDLLAIPSRWEGFGMVALEAMSAGLPVVASRVDALPEIVSDGETGLLVPPEDPCALGNALTLMLGEPQKACRLGQAGQRRLRDYFSVERMTSATLDMYQSLCRGAAPIAAPSRERRRS